MDSKANQFVHNATIALQDIDLQTALDRGTANSVAGRLSAMGETLDPPALRAQARAARLRALHDLPDLLEQFEANVTAHGGHVLWAEDGEECNRHVLDIAWKHDVRTVVKGKSMATEETGLNHALEAGGLEVVETDLGEFIAQVAGETPSHIVMPVIHKTKEQVRDLFMAKLGMAYTDSPEEMTAFARTQLRQKFLAADMGISGANIVIAETGTVCIVSNEGNNRLSTSAPRVHVAVVGIEKLVATVEDFGTLVQLLPRSATGQRLSVYVHMVSGPARPEDPDGPDEFYVILLDNGRSRIRATEYAEALACIRCGACLNTCPVYQNTGGHAYGWVYSGPIGAVVTPLLLGLENAKPLPHASSLCGACKAACPVDIDIPTMLLKLRRDLVEEGQADLVISLGIKGWATAMQSPRLFELGGLAARLGTKFAARGDGQIHRLPGPLGHWTQNRDFPAFAPKSFRQLWRERKKGNGS